MTYLCKHLFEKHTFF